MASSGMKTIRLGEVFQVSNERLGDYSEEPPVFAISKYDGVVLGSDYHDRRVASDKLNTYKVLAPADWAYSTIHIDEGSIARSDFRFLGVVSPMYTILRWISELHDPRYFEHLLRSPEMLATYGDMAQGSINRRRSLPWKSFSSISVSVPSLEEQRRVVDLVGTVDEAIAATDVKTDALKKVASALRQSTFEELLQTYPESTAGQIFEVTLGRQKSARQLHGDNEIPYIRAANISDGSLSLGDVQKMNFDPREQSKYGLQEGDVLVVEGGSVGQTAVWKGEIAGPVGFDKHVLRLRGLEACSTSSFANQWARWCYESGRFEAQARGITIKALGYQRAKDMIAPALPISRQNEVTDLLDSADAAASSSMTASDSLRTIRAELLASLLSGAHRIPESYDELMGV